jgi:hypothetical protein
MLFLALAAAAAGPQPGALKTFTDWTVGCDNTLDCRAVALVPEGEDREAYLLLVIDRGGAPAARPVLTFSTGTELPAARRTLRVDGKPVAQVTSDVLPFDRALASALANGKRATLTDANGRTVASASLGGVAAAFLYMDERQRRLGTVGALRRTGPKPDAAVPPPPAPPRIARPPASSKPSRTVTAAKAAALIGPDNATCEYAQGPVEPVAHRLDAARTLVLVTHPCGNGAYNIMTSAYLIDEVGRATPATFDSPPGMNPDGGHVLVNAGWDASQRRLSEFVKARGLGDCGGSSAYAWDGTRFRLVEASQMGECRGSLDYITTWRAEVD